MAVVRLRALCELEGEEPPQVDFRVSEYAVLDDGTEVLLHSERGFSIAARGSADVWQHATAAGIERGVMTVVLPDHAEETGEEHPWDWFVHLLGRAGVAAGVEHLRGVPYEVHLEQRVRLRLEAPGEK